MAEPATTTPPATTPPPAAPESVTPPPAPAAAAPTPPPVAKTPPWGSDENFTPAKAWELIENLRKEKAPDTKALETKVAEMQAAAEARNKVLAEAFGLAEPPKTENDLAETVRSLQEKFEAADRLATKLRVAAEKGIPAEYHDLLTETDTEKLTAQAEKVAALVKANANPEFQANPGQGQSGQPPTAEAIADAEYNTYFPPPPTRK